MKTLAIAFVALAATLAHAEPEKPASAPPDASWGYGMHMVSLHRPGSGMRTLTPGVYALHKSSGFTIGAYNNSLGRASVYTGLTLERGNFQLTLGAVTGYSKAKVLPMAAPSYKMADGWRISAIPNPFGESALHLSKEF